VSIIPIIFEVSPGDGRVADQNEWVSVGLDGFVPGWSFNDNLFSDFHRCREVHQSCVDAQKQVAEFQESRGLSQILGFRMQDSAATGLTPHESFVVLLFFGSTKEQNGQFRVGGVEATNEA
jgi:hypothetical protein